MWQNFISPRNNLFHTHKYLWQGTDPQMGPICSEWYSQSDRRKILEPSWSVLGTQPHCLKTLNIAPKCGMIKFIFHLTLRMPKPKYISGKIGDSFHCKVISSHSIAFVL